MGVRELKYLGYAEDGSEQLDWDMSYSDSWTDDKPRWDRPYPEHWVKRRPEGDGLSYV